MMEKNLFDNNWFVGLVSLFFALVLFVSVSNENNNLSTLLRTNNSASIDTTVTISNVPVNLGEHDEGTFISGMPETVSVSLTGPRNIVNQITASNFTVQTETLVGAEAGVRAIRFEVKGLPNTIEYKVTPDLFYGTISTKETVDKDIEYELADNVIAEGYQLQKVTLNLSKVTLSGSSDEIAKVARVVAMITAETPQEASFKKTYRLQILDIDGNPLDVNPSVSEVEASVEILPPENAVSLVIVPVGEDPALNYSYQFVGPSTIRVSGSAANQYHQLNVMVDVSQIMTSTTLTGTVESVDGLTLSQSEILIAVTVTDLNQSETFTTTQSEETTTITEMETTVEE